jgi:hypothetical protein
MTDLGITYQFLSIGIYTIPLRYICLSQHRLIDTILMWIQMANCNRVAIPME